jgi:hypothetical protein
MVIRAQYRWLLGGGLLAALIALGGVAAHGRSEATREARAVWQKYQQIQVGMMLTEVLTTLGNPTGTLDDATAPALYWDVDGHRRIVIGVDMRTCAVGHKEWLDGDSWQRLERRLFW